MGPFYADRSSGSERNKRVRLEARGMIGKPLKDQSFDENYNAYSFGNVKTNIEALLEDAGYKTEEYRVETSSDNIGMEFDRKKKIFDGLQEILDAQEWLIRERAEGYLVIGSSTYSEFETASDYEFEYGEDLYGMSFASDDNESYTRVCVHTEDYSVAYYTDVTIYTSWKIGEQKTYYLQVPDGTTLASATIIGDDLATKFSNSGTIESFKGPFRPYIIPGDGAKITKDGIERTVGVITNIRHILGQGGFRTEFDVDTGGVVGVGRMKDYIKGLQKKQTKDSTRSYS
jgi:hypothetical protein